MPRPGCVASPVLGLYVFGDARSSHAVGRRHNTYFRAAEFGTDSLIRGIEKESLRVNLDGSLSQLPHPTALGSALTHRAITTDFLNPSSN